MRASMRDLRIRCISGRGSVLWGATRGIGNRCELMSNDPFASSVLKTQAMAIGTGGPARVVFDLTTTAMWSGAPAGIVRVECEFARWALDHLEGVVFAFFNPDTRTFCHLSHEMAKRL